MPQFLAVRRKESSHFSVVSFNPEKLPSDLDKAYYLIKSDNTEYLWVLTATDHHHAVEVAEQEWDDWVTGLVGNLANKNRFVVNPAKLELNSPLFEALQKTTLDYLKRFDNNVTRTAEKLGFERTAFVKFMRRLNIKREDPENTNNHHGDRTKLRYRIVESCIE